LILTSIAVAALVSTIIGGAFTMWNDHLRRSHETQVRSDDRDHEARMQVLVDRRAQRDRRSDRIYGNLHTIVDAALAIALQVQIIRSVPQKYKDAAPEMEAATEKLKAVQPAIRLDRETDALYERVVKAVYAYNLWWIGLDIRQRASESADERLGEYTKDAIEQGVTLTTLLDEIIVEARAALERAEAAVE
jgi:hypothetical protein